METNDNLTFTVIASTFVTSHQPSCRKVMFSVVSVCLSFCPQVGVPCGHYIIIIIYHPLTSLHRNPPPPPHTPPSPEPSPIPPADITCPNLFNFNLNVQGSPLVTSCGHNWRHVQTCSLQGSSEF